MIIAHDVGAEPGYLANHEGTRSEMIAPVVIDERVVGTLDIESEIPHAFGENDRHQAERLVQDTRVPGRSRHSGGDTAEVATSWPLR